MPGTEAGQRFVANNRHSAPLYPLAYHPLSTQRALPLMKLDSSEARNTTATGRSVYSGGKRTSVWPFSS